MKSYIIHILGIRAMTAEAFDLPLGQNAIIDCAESRSEFIEEVFDPRLALKIRFADIEDPSHPTAITSAHARAIIRFIEDLPEEVTDVYVCCEKGGSRSPAVAAALLRASGRSDVDVWRNPYYVPNKLVYRTLCKQLGLRASRLSVWLRGRINERAFVEAQRSVGSSKYERWQILE